MGAPIATHPDYFTYRMKRLYLLINQRIDDALKPYGLGRSQWQVLFRVRRCGALTQKDLQQAMQVESATLTGIVGALVTKGWLERLESPDDKRVRILRLTKEGQARLEVPDPYELVEARMLRGVSEPDRTRVESLLDDMIRNLQDRS